MLKGRDLCRVLHQRGPKKNVFPPTRHRHASAVASGFKGGRRGGGGLLWDFQGVLISICRTETRRIKRGEAHGGRSAPVGSSHSLVFTIIPGRDDEVKAGGSAAPHSPPGPGSLRQRGTSIQKKRIGKLPQVQRVLGDPKLSICVCLLREFADATSLCLL